MVGSGYRRMLDKNVCFFVHCSNIIMRINLLDQDGSTDS